MSKLHGPDLTKEQIPMVVAAMSLIYHAHSVDLVTDSGEAFDDEFREHVCNLTGVIYDSDFEKQQQDLNDALHFLLNAQFQSCDPESYTQSSSSWWPLLVTLTFYDGFDVPEKDRRRCEVAVNPYFVNKNKRFYFSPIDEILRALQNCVAW